jgi:hypothetical protein
VSLNRNASPPPRDLIEARSLLGRDALFRDARADVARDPVRCCQHLGEILGAGAKVRGQIGLLVDVVVRQLGPRVLQAGPNLHLARHKIGVKRVCAYVEPEIHMQRPVAAFVRVLDVILNFELSGHAGKALLEELGEPVHVLDIVADDTAADQIAAFCKCILGLPSLGRGLPLDA